MLSNREARPPLCLEAGPSSLGGAECGGYEWGEDVVSSECDASSSEESAQEEQEPFVVQTHELPGVQ